MPPPPPPDDTEFEMTRPRLARSETTASVSLRTQKTKAIDLSDYLCKYGAAQYPWADPDSVPCANVSARFYLRSRQKYILYTFGNARTPEKLELVPLRHMPVWWQNMHDLSAEPDQTDRATVTDGVYAAR